MWECVLPGVAFPVEEFSRKLISHFHNTKETMLRRITKAGDSAKVDPSESECPFSVFG